MMKPSHISSTPRINISFRNGKNPFGDLSKIGCPYATSVDIIKTALQELGIEDAVTSRQGKRVRFNTACDQTCPSPQPLSPEEIDATWWKRSDFDESLSAFRASVGSHRIEYQEKLAQIIALCNESENDVLEDVTTKHLVPIETRGLEPDVAPILKIYRRKHSQTVLQFRAPQNLPKDLQQRMLSARSMHLSRPHKALAHLLAQADELAAREQNEY